MKWRLDADNLVAPFRRRFGGALTPTTKWLLNAENSQLVKRTNGNGHFEVSEYDQMDNLNKFTDANNHETLFVFDKRNRLISKTDARSKTESYRYDPGGLRVGLTDRKGQVTFVERDLLGRPMRTNFGASIQAPTTFTSFKQFTWDAGSRLRQVSDSRSNIVALDYDGENRVTNEVTPNGQLDYTFYANGRRKTMTVLGQPVVNYAWNQGDQLSKIQQGGDIVEFAYDQSGRRNLLKYPSDVTLAYEFDAVSRPIALNYKRSGAALGNLIYSYNEEGRVASRGGDWGTHAESIEVNNAVYDDANRLTTWGANASSYDDNGNLLNDGLRTYLWDELDRLTQTQDTTGSIITFQYDGL